MAFLRSARASSDGLSASDYVADKDTWLRTGDPKGLPDTAQETRMQAIIRIAAQAAARVRRMVRWRPEKIRAPEKPAPTPMQAPAPDAPQEQRQASEAPATERLVRVYAAKVSRGEMGFTEAVDTLVSANQRKAERTLEYHWNPVHPIATPKGGLRPADRASWMSRLERQISLFEQGSTAALRPELASVKQQVEARAAPRLRRRYRSAGIAPPPRARQKARPQTRRRPRPRRNQVVPPADA